MAISKMIHSVAVGDESVGKTSLLIALNKKPFKEFNPPITFEIYEDIFCKQEKYILSIVDTSDRVDSELRQLTYSPARKNDVFLLCFSLNSKKSFESITRRWTKDVKHYCKHSKIILIGTKSDLREPGNPDHVSDEEAKQLVFNQKFYCYIPCSSKTGENIDSIFPSIIKCFNNKSLHKKRSCGLNYFRFFYIPFLYFIFCIPQYVHSLFVLSNDGIKTYFNDNILFNLSTYIKYVSISVIIFNLFVIFIPIDFNIKLSIFLVGACFYVLLAIAQIGVGSSLILISIKSNVCESNDFEVCENLKKKFLFLGINLLVTSVIYIYLTWPLWYSVIISVLGKIFSFF